MDKVPSSLALLFIPPHPVGACKKKKKHINEIIVALLINGAAAIKKYSHSISPAYHKLCPKFQPIHRMDSPQYNLGRIYSRPNPCTIYYFQHSRKIPGKGLDSRRNARHSMIGE
eukprot:scaffold182293_cov73-Cyclotella_meneghiniana.AAC.1